MIETQYMQYHNTLQEKTCCDKMVIICDQGYYLCKSCGIVHGPEFINSERPAFELNERKRRKRTEVRWQIFGARTIMNNLYMDSRGVLLEPKKKVLYIRLNKIQKSFITTLERNLWEAKPFLTNLCSLLTIPSVIQDTAWRIYIEVAKKKLTCGRKIRAFVAASLYAAIRIHDLPYLMEEIARISTISIHHIHKYLSLIVQYVLPEIHLQYKSMGLKMLVYRFGEDLKLSIATQQKAYTLLQTVRRRGLRDMGIDPKGLAAAALYVSIRKSTEKRTQTEITKIAGITEVTLRTRVKQITFYLIN